jgi:ferredoxin-like protein FixX
MTLRKKRNREMGDDHVDLRESMLRWSVGNGYPIERFVDVLCACGADVFQFACDEDAGVAMRTCVTCKAEHVMCDGDEYVEEADELERRACFCIGESFQGAVGVSLYAGSNDVRWFYLGMRCISCSVLGIYADWKSESGDVNNFLAKV